MEACEIAVSAAAAEDPAERKQHMQLAQVQVFIDPSRPTREQTTQLAS